jgi:Alternative oxidase
MRTAGVLQDGASMRDLLLAVRADEASHNHVNHVLASLKPDDDNPFSGKNSHIIP